LCLGVIDNHYNIHAEEFNFPTLDEYVKQSYEVIKNPENIYVQKHKKILTNKKTIKTTKYVFEKDRKIVVVNDDNLVIASYHKLGNNYNSYIDRYFGEKYYGKIGIIKIL